MIVALARVYRCPTDKGEGASCLPKFRVCLGPSGIGGFEEQYWIFIGISGGLRCFILYRISLFFDNEAPTEI